MHFCSIHPKSLPLCMEGFKFKTHLKCNQCRKLSLHTISHNSHWGILSFDWPQLCYRSNFRVTQPEHYVDSIKLDIYGKLLGRSIWEIISDWSAQSWMFENVRREREVSCGIFYDHYGARRRLREFCVRYPGSQDGGGMMRWGGMHGKRMRDKKEEEARKL